MDVALVRFIEIFKMKLCIFVLFFMCCLSCSYTAPSESTLKDTGEDVKETLEEAGRELVEQGN